MSLPSGQISKIDPKKLENAKKIEAVYEDHSERAEEIKQQARRLLADQIKTGDITVPEEFKEKLKQDGPKMREGHIKNMPKNVNKQDLATGKKSAYSTVESRPQPIPNYVSALDYACVPENQNYALISYLGPRNCRPVGEEFAFRLWGVFPTRKEANDYVEYVRRTNQYAKFYDILCFQLGGWTPFPPIINEKHEIKFQNEHLQEFHNTHLEEQKKAQLEHENRLKNTDDINVDVNKEIERMSKESRQKLHELGIHTITPEIGDVTYEKRFDENGNIQVVKKTRKKRRKSGKK